MSAPDTEITIPPDAARPCRCGGTMVPVSGTLDVDEGNGSASVALKCAADCGVHGGHDWALSDDEFEAKFGYRFGERPDDDDEEEES